MFLHCCTQPACLPYPASQPVLAKVSCQGPSVQALATLARMPASKASPAPTRDGVPQGGVVVKAAGNEETCVLRGGEVVGMCFPVLVIW